MTYNFDQESNLCPEHGLSLNSEFLCTVCKLELEGHKGFTYKRCELLESGRIETEEKPKRKKRNWRKNAKNSPSAVDKLPNELREIVESGKDFHKSK